MNSVAELISMSCVKRFFRFRVVGWRKSPRYSWAEICWSESRQALIFSRLHTQHKSSVACGLVRGVQTELQTAQRFGAAGLPLSTDFFAISIISGEMIGSAMAFFFILDFTIEQIGPGATSMGTKTNLTGPDYSFYRTA